MSTKEEMSEARANILAETMKDAILGFGWRKVIVGVPPDSLEALETWISSLRKADPQSVDDVLEECVSEGTRRVVILIEPERRDG